MRLILLLASLGLSFGIPRHGNAVIFASTGDPLFNTTAPAGELEESGWKFQGLWQSFLGTPIAPNYFITAAHIGGSLGSPFLFQGNAFVTDAFFDDPETDLR